MPQMTSQEQKLNDFLVGVFNDILRLEEASLRQSCGNLSVTELHVLDAVSHCAPPVSYTHLDVYKRQFPCRFIVPGPLPQRPP